MNLKLLRVIPIETAFAEARKAPLEMTGGDEILFYKDADLTLAQFHPEELNPVSIYLLKKNLEFQRELHKWLLDEHGLDTLHLSSVIHLLKDDGGIEGLIPPYVEISPERVKIIARAGENEPPESTLQIPILPDGLHRAQLAREKGSSLTCIKARGIPPEYLYCAYPVSWSDVQIYDSVPPKKRLFRKPQGYYYMRPLRVLRLMPPTPEYGRQ